MHGFHAAALRGKTVAVTGCTGGLGRELCLFLASQGAVVCMLDRNAEKSKLLAGEIKKKYPDYKAVPITVDLEDFSAVKKALAQLRQLHLDIFIQNAGAYSIPRHRCSTGLDNVFQINFAAPYYLIRSLLNEFPALKVVAVGSIAHRYSKSDPNDMDFSTRRSAAKVYGNAKRYLMFSLYEAVQKQPQARLAVVHPGITFTNITAHYPKWLFWLIKYPMKIIFMSPKRAARCLVAGLREDCQSYEWIGPRFFDIWGAPVKRRLHSCAKPEICQIAMAAEQIFKLLENTD